MNAVKKIVFALVASALTLSAATTFADEIVVEAHLLGVQTTNEGFAGIMGQTNSAGAGIVAGYELGQVEGLRLLLSFSSDGRLADRFDGQVRSDWGRNRVMVGADYGIPLFNDILRPLVRTTVGYSYQELHLTADNLRYFDRAHGVAALAAAGLQLKLEPEIDPDAWWTRISIGGNYLYGYLWQSPTSFDSMRSAAAPEEPSEEDPWIRSTYDAGSMQMSGRTWSLGVVLQFRL